MKIKKDFKLREICGEYVVTAEGMQAVDFTKLISLNETAAFLWKAAEKQGEFTVASLAQALCDEYDVVMAQAEKDCEAIIAHWQKEGLLSGSMHYGFSARCLQSVSVCCCASSPVSCR